MITPYSIFRIVQSAQGRRAGDVDNFESGNQYGFFCLLLKYFTNDLKFTSEKQIKTFIAICAKNTGHAFSPFQLNSPRYLEIFNIWYRKNSNLGSYYNNINESFRNIFKFCCEKNIKTIEDYIKNWGCSHISSGVLDENIAMAMGLGDIKLSKPEQILIGKKFIKHQKAIKERIEREAKLKMELEEGIKELSAKLISKFGGINKDIDLAKENMIIEF